MHNRKVMENQEQNNIIRVLIADDNPTFSKTLEMMIKTVLADREAIIEKAANGLEAIEKVKNNGNFKVIFMDVNMPAMDGFVATRLISKEKFPQTKIIAVSFLKDIHTVSKMLESGADMFLFKDKLGFDTIEKVFNIQAS